jgi:hypothetical protein
LEKLAGARPVLDDWPDRWGRVLHSHASDTLAGATPLATAQSLAS